MEDKNQRKEEISNAAKELFTDFGFKSVSMEQIAMRANVGKGTLYLYFKDKEDLFFSLAKKLMDDVDSFMQACQDKQLSFFDEIHEIIYNLLMYRRSHKFLYRMSQEAREYRTPSAIKVLQMFDDEVCGYLEKKLQKAIDEGYLKPCNVSVLSFIIVRLYKALAFEWEETHEPLNEKQIAESVLLFVKDGLVNKNMIME